MPNTHTGPSAAESRLLAVCDVFYHLLNAGQLQTAAALAYKLDTIAQAYVQPKKKGRKKHEQPVSIHHTAAD